MPSANSFSNILILGAGELGLPVIRELLALTPRVGAISVLLPPLRRETSEASKAQRRMLRGWGVEIIEADLATSSVQALSTLFTRFNQVVGCTGFVGGPGTQRKIAEAALAADIAHYVPWQFGVDYDRIGRGSGQEVFDEQLEIRQLLRAQSRVQWTIVSTGMFTPFVFLPAFGLVDLEQRKVHALGDWDHRLTVTTPEDIGRLTARVVAFHAEHANEIVYLSGDTFSYRELADTVERVLGHPMERVLWSVQALRAEVHAHPDDTMRKYRLVFARDSGVAWPKADTLNASLGLAMEDLAT